MFSIAGWEIRRNVKSAPAKGAPAKGAPVKGATARSAPVKGAPVKGAPVKGAPVKGAPAKNAPKTKAPPKTKAAAKAKAAVGAAKSKAASAKTKPAGTGTRKPSGTAARTTGKTGGKATGTAKKAAPGARKPQGPPAAAAAAPSASPPLQRDSFGSRAGRVLVMLLAFVCMVGFAAALAKATLVPQPGSSDLVHTNLQPGDSLRAYLDQPAIRDSVKQIGGNVLLGAPFGVLLPMLVPKARGAVRVVLVTSLVMVLVEVAQGAIVEGRAFDIDDVILNTSGALLGYFLIGRRLGHALHPRRHHWWQRRGKSA